MTKEYVHVEMSAEADILDSTSCYTHSDIQRYLNARAKEGWMLEICQVFIKHYTYRAIVIMSRKRKKKKGETK